MGIRITPPLAEDLAAMRQRARSEPLSYAPAGVVIAGGTIPGFRRDRWSRVIGHGADVFARASEALLSWEVQRRSGLIVNAAGPPVEGQVVAMAAPLPVGYVDLLCRVVAMLDEPYRRGFVYGTLSDHPEMGEESFSVQLTEDGSVVFEIAAVWRLRHPLARLVPPVAKLLQRRATERYFDAMLEIVGTPGT